MLDPADTIVAVATAPGGGARAVVRLSGPAAWSTIDPWFAAADAAAPAGRVPRVVAGRLHVAPLVSPLPCHAWHWPAARSFTRQPVVELHLPGSPPLVEAVVGQCCRSGARLAAAGEFTLRAFLAGRIDLTQAEAVLGTIDARNAAQLETALRQLAGGLSQPLSQLRGTLLDALAHLEAGLDFVDEDIEFITPAELTGQIAATLNVVERLLRQVNDRGVAGELPLVVLAGPPNAGKSSLFNALVGSEAALVSSQAGTTRDYLTASVRLDGGACQLVDTAGRDDEPAQHSIDHAAQQSAAEQAQRAALRLWCQDATTAANTAPPVADSAVDTLLVWTKVDLLGGCFEAPAGLATSATTGQGIDELRRAINQRLADSPPPHGAVSATAARCRNSLERACEALHTAAQLVANRAGEELVAAELRGSLHALGEVAGEVYTDDVLDRIFSRFCIGK